MTRVRILPLALLVSIFASMFVTRQAEAQEEQAGQPYWISTPPGAPDLLAAANEAVAAKEWAAAARSLQSLFDRFPDAFLKRGAGDLYVGAREGAVQLLAAMPQEMRAAYEATNGAAATEILLQALASGDRALLLDVVRRYEPTEAGLRAIVALADRALLRGRPTEARLLLERIRTLHPEAAASAPVLSRLERAAARDHAEGGPEPLVGASGDSPVPAPGPARLIALANDAWPMLGGDARRTKIAPPLLERGERASIPRLFGDPRWSVAVEIPERLWEQSPRPSTGFPFDGYESHDSEWALRWRDFLPIEPILARGKLVYHDGREVVACNLFTGDLLWSWPPEVEVTNEGRTNLSQIFAPVTTDGVVYAAVEVPVDYVSQRLQQVPITYYIPERRFCALDLESGAPRWAHTNTFLAARGAPGDETLAGLSIISAPLVRGDHLYAVAAYSEGTFHTFAVAVDRHTGLLAWATRIHVGQQELNLFGRQLQECAATPVAESEGVLYFGTNLGVFAAVDALLGAPIWAAPYPIESIPSTYLWFEAPRRWAHFSNGPPLILDSDIPGGQVVVAPTDGTSLLSFHRPTGRLLWRIPARRGVGPKEVPFAPRILHGADKERLYVGGSGGVAAVRVRPNATRTLLAGHVEWTQLLPPEEASAGRGILAEDGLWIPTYGGVQRIDPSTGKLVAHYPRRGPEEEGDHPCHLIWGDGVLVTAGSQALVARYDGNDVAALMRDRIRNDPDGIAPLLAAGDLHLATGGVSQAVAHYSEAILRAEARGIGAAERRGRQGRYRALMKRAEQVLESEPAKAPAEYEVAFRHAPDPLSLLRGRSALEEHLGMRSHAGDREWRLRNLRELERGYGDQPEDGAFLGSRTGTLRRMAGLLLEMQQPKRALAELQRLLEMSGTGKDAREARGEIRDLLGREGRRLYDPYEKRARQLFAAALEAGDLQALEKGLRIYSNSEAAVETTLELARRRLASGQLDLGVETLREFLVEHAESPRAPLALWMMAEGLDRFGSPGPALATLLRLRERHGEMLLPRQDGAQVPARDLVDAMLEREPYATLARSAHRRHLEPPLEQRFRRELETQAPLDIPDLAGPRPESLSHALLVKLGTEIVALDARSGETLRTFKFGGREPLDPLVFVGERLFGVTDYEVQIFDSATGALLERRGLPDQGRAQGLVEDRGQVFLLYRTRGALAQVGVAALHPVDGTTLWSLPVPVEGAEEMVVHRHTLSDGHRVLVFSEQRPARMTVLSATSGAIENRIRIADGRLALRPRLLPDGRVLVALRTSVSTPGLYEPSYLIALVDPDKGVLWSYTPPDNDRNRGLVVLHVVRNEVIAVDMSLDRVVLDLATGAVLVPPAALELQGMVPSRPVLESPQVEQEGLLLLLTRPMQDVSARLYGFESPYLASKWHLELSTNDREQVEAVESEGVLAFLVSSPGRRLPRPPRVLIVDPLAARRIQELTPPIQDEGWITPRVQNGILLLATSTNVLYAFGPK